MVSRISIMLIPFFSTNMTHSLDTYSQERERILNPLIYFLRGFMQSVLLFGFCKILCDNFPTEQRGYRVVMVLTRRERRALLF